MYFYRILYRTVILCFALVSAEQHLCGEHYLKFKDEFVSIEPSHEQHRLLMTSVPHPLRIFGHFPTQGLGGLDIKTLRVYFGIAALYFKKVLTVTNLAVDQNTLFDSSTKCGSSDVPDTYRKIGFNPLVTDMVVFILLVEESDQSYVALASACIKKRRPIYGQITYNSRFVKTEISNVKKFHSYIEVTLHELTHLLGFSFTLFKGFYRSPTSIQKLESQQVLTIIQNRTYIITPSVLAYVQHYFGCKDNVTGALLEDSSDLSAHWEKSVYLDEVMTATSWEAGLRISLLTLLLLQDSGFYASVDISLVEPVKFGYKKGCRFARGEGLGRPEYCNPLNNVQCGFYSQFIGTCANSDIIPNKSGNIVTNRSKSLCSDPELEEIYRYSFESDRNSWVEFSVQSRCIRTNFSEPGCYPAKCVNGQVVISVHKVEKTCSEPNEIMVIQNQTVICPEDFDIFCSVKVCPNWCSNHGLCINGTCICNPPWHSESCSEICSAFYDEDQPHPCVLKCPDGKVNGPDKVCMRVCPSGYIRDSNNVCIACEDSCESSQKIINAKGQKLQGVRTYFLQTLFLMLFYFI